MSQQVFNARVDLLASSITENPNIFIVEFNIYDGTGQFGSTSIQVGDILYLDTYNYNATISKYKITEILGASGTYFNGKIEYVDTGDVVDPNNLAQGPGSANGYITTPSLVRKLAWHSAPTVHTFADYITQYARDQELWEKLDGMSITGPQGVAGATGIAGVVGATGLPGADGVTGPLGSAGSAGAQGETGLAGSAGPQGVTGLAGSAGSAGAQGETGLVGSAGSAGPQGVTGLAGSAGSAGPQGVTGLAGSAGSAGPQGVTGLAGSAGSAGPQGVTGLAGSAGSAGPQGVTGLAGSTGSAGAQGVTGAGIQGVTGIAGSAGSAGPQGVTGLAGSAGAQGVTGAGVQGATGVAGAAGSQGVTGALGLQGVTGASGGGEGVRTLTFASGTIALRAAGLISALSGVNAVKDFTVASTSRCILTVPSGVEILEIHCTFTAAETVGRTQFNFELPDPSGATTMPNAFRPYMAKWNATYGFNNAISTCVISGGILTVAATGMAAGAEQKCSLWV